MRLLKIRPLGFCLGVVLLFATAIGGSALVYADSGTANATLRAGSLTESNATNHVSVQVQKKARLVSYSLPITAIDARGSGSGWQLTVTSTRFAMKSGPVIYRLPANASNLVGMRVACGAHSTCTNPVNSLSYPLPVPAGNPPPPAVKFFDAAAHSGLGYFLLRMTVNVSIPADAKPGTYTSTVILAIANGP